MKRMLVLLAMLMILLPTIMVAQGLAIKTALNFSQWESDALMAVNNRTGYRLGLSYGWAVADKLVLAPGIHYAQKGMEQRYSDSFDNVSYEEQVLFTTKHIDVPIMLQYAVSDNFYFLGGPYLSMLLSEEGYYADKECVDGTCVGDQETIKDELLKNSDFGFEFGLGGTIWKRLLVEATYQMGATSISSDNNYDVFNRSLVFTLGVKL